MELSKDIVLLMDRFFQKATTPALLENFFSSYRLTSSGLVVRKSKAKFEAHPLKITPFTLRYYYLKAAASFAVPTPNIDIQRKALEMLFSFNYRRVPVASFSNLFPSSLKRVVSPDLFTFVTDGDSWHVRTSFDFSAYEKDSSVSVFDPYEFSQDFAAEPVPVLSVSPDGELSDEPNWDDLLPDDEN